MNGLPGNSYTRVSLNVNSTYIDSYTFADPNNPVIDPVNLPHFSMNIISFQNPVILLRNNNFQGKYLQVYEILFRESGAIGQNCRFGDGCSVGWLELGTTAPTV